jgi:hypothetical protein
MVPGALKLPGQVQLVLGRSARPGPQRHLQTLSSTLSTENAGEDLILHRRGPHSSGSNLSASSDQLITSANSRPASFAKFCPPTIFTYNVASFATKLQGQLEPLL